MKDSSLMIVASVDDGAANQAFTYVAIFYLALVRVGGSVGDGVLRSTQCPQF